MKIRLPRIVVGRNIVGMQIALQNNAVFIPISFLPSFGWETLDEDLPIITYLRSRRGFQREHPSRYIITSEEGTKEVSCFQWELEDLYQYLLFMSNALYSASKSERANLLSENTLSIVSSYGNSVEIEFEKCWIINPEEEWFNSIFPVEETIEGETSHLLYTLFLSKDTDDMKGISSKYDIETLEGEFFTKIWYGPLFGPKKFLLGNDPRKKKQTITTRHICLFKENVANSELEDEIYSVAEARKEIYKLLAPRHKRISDRILTFDKSISKIELSSKIDIYKNLENIEFVYYTDKEEILCQKNLNYLDWPLSYPRILISRLAEITSLQ